MKICRICNHEIAPGSGAVSIVGGVFPCDDPDFFLIDEGILRESYTHKECLLQLRAPTSEPCAHITKSC